VADLVAHANRGERVSAAAWRTLAVLVAMYLLSLLDRQLLSLLIQPIKADLHLDDTQIGAVQGIAFVLFYSVMGLLLAWAVDRYSRQVMVFVGVIVWSLSTVACGLARSFGDLFGARLIVGFGEAVVGPASSSLIGGLFPRARLSLAMGIYYSASGAGSLIAFWFGGWLTEQFTARGGLGLPFVGHLRPWQAVFVLAGLAGLVFAPAAFAMASPKKTSPGLDGVPAPVPETLVSFARRRGALWACHALAFGILNMCCYAQISWTPAYLTRVFHAPLSTVGLVMGLSFGVCCAIGQLFWGAVIDRMIRRGVADAHYRLYSLMIPLAVPFAIAAYTVPNFYLSAALICLLWFIMLPQGPLQAAMLMCTPAHLRGRVSAAAGLASGILAIGLTPFLIGVMNDHVFHDETKVGWSIAVFMTVFGLLGSAILFLARPLLRKAVEEEDALIGTGARS
jgi:MFS family permease